MVYNIYEYINFILTILEDWRPKLIEKHTVKLKDDVTGAKPYTKL